MGTCRVSLRYLRPRDTLSDGSPTFGPRVGLCPCVSAGVNPEWVSTLKYFFHGSPD